tara:strand:- start:315 stop:848 length:534 start_codon:yes stop_codon:yes gene_type:complete
MFERIKPFFLTAIIQQAKSGLAGTEPVDMHLYNYAKKSKKKCIGLETLDEQLSAIDEMSIQEQVSILLETIKSDSVNNGLDEILGHYIDQNLIKLKEIIDNEDMSLELKESMLDNRNHRIASRISEVTKSKKIFSAVGAAHLIGEKGILSYLKEKGFKVSPIKLELKKNLSDGEGDK